VVTPWFRVTDAVMDATAEAETIGQGAVEWGQKTVTLSKIGKAISYTDEMMLSVSLPVLSHWMRDLGTRLSAKLNTMAVTTLVNGDQADGSDSCAVVGVDDTSKGIVYADFVSLWVRGNLLNKNWYTMVANENVANTVLNLSEFKAPQGAGSPYVQIRNRPEPASMPLFVSSSVADDQILFVDPAASMIQLNFMPLRVESDRIVLRQISGTVCSLITGFTTIVRKNRVIMDATKARANYNFPSWMTYE